MASSSESSRAPHGQKQATTPEENEKLCDRLVFNLLEKLKGFKSDVNMDIDVMKELNAITINWKEEHYAQGIVWSQLTQEVGLAQETLADMETHGYSSRERDRNKIIKKYEQALEAQKRFLQFCEKHMPPRR